MKNNDYMQSLIEQFPNNISEALTIASQNSLKKTYPGFENVVICGMGGSGIGGKLVASWIINDIDIPINFCQDYTLPNYVNEKTLIIASSNSGNTEETLSAAENGRLKGASIIAVCSGGKLEEYCNNWNYECIIVPGNNPPRTTLAFSLIQLTHIFTELNLIGNQKLNEFSLAKESLLLNKDEIQREAKSLAQFINGKNLIVYSEAKDEAIAIRARQQFNENSKMLCNHHVIPEMNHNELVGWYGGSNDYAVLLLEIDRIHIQNKKRMDFSIDFIKSKTNSIKILKSKGNSIIESSLYIINIIDWASLYLARENNIDSVEIDVITKLKNSLV